MDTCAAEFEAYTPYYYSTYDRGDDEVQALRPKKVMILGGGPNRIGQGIEFDYCCVHAAFALKEDGFETIMVNSNPETVSTDYDTSDKLYFEPLTLEDVLHIYEREKCWGAIAQFGGQTPLNLALGLQKNGVNIIGTSPQSIEIAEDRKLFAAMLHKLNIPQPPNGIATNEAEALGASQDSWVIPCWCALSFVLGGRAMQIVYSDAELQHYMRFAVEASPRTAGAGGQIPRRRHRSGRGLHRGRGPFRRSGPGHTLSSAACWSTSNLPACIPAMPRWCCRRTRFRQKVIDTIRDYTHAMARELNVVGLMNVQYAVKDEDGLCAGSQSARLAHRAVCQQGHRRAAGQTGGQSHGRQNARRNWDSPRKSGRSIGRSRNRCSRSTAFTARTFCSRRKCVPPAKSWAWTRTWASPTPNRRWRLARRCRRAGTCSSASATRTRPHVAAVARQFANLGFELVATGGTAAVLEKAGLKVQRVFKLVRRPAQRA